VLGCYAELFTRILSKKAPRKRIEPHCFMLHVSILLHRPTCKSVGVVEKVDIVSRTP
jgi:hypothetical protein